MKQIDAQLKDAPEVVRARMMADASRLKGGAAAVVGRFYKALVARDEREAAPSRETFETAAASESTLALLVRSLEAYAPQVNLAVARDIRAEYYRARLKSAHARRRSGPLPLPATAPAAWPALWRSLYPALREAPIEESSRRRYIASIDRCAELLPESRRPDFTFRRWTAFELYRAMTEAQLRPATARNYLHALVMLGEYGGLDVVALRGFREMRTIADQRARRLGKLKAGRLKDFEALGGYGVILGQIVELRRRAAGEPDDEGRVMAEWSAAAEDARRMAVVLAVLLNAPARTGDASRWRLGRDIVRLPAGAWRLAWEQEKTDRRQDPGELWPAIWAVLDDHILGGRPREQVWTRYRQLAGRNWLTLDDQDPAAKYPSALVKRAIGIPSQDLRTLAADTLRRIDPAHAAELVQTLLGHADRRSGEAYRALAQGLAAGRAWGGIRREIGGTRQFGRAAKTSTGATSS